MHSSKINVINYIYSNVQKNVTIKKYIKTELSCMCVWGNIGTFALHLCLILSNH